MGTRAFAEASLNLSAAMTKFVFGDENLNETWLYYRLGQNVLVEPYGSTSTGLVYLPLDWLGSKQENYLMDLSTGIFTEITWSSIDDGRYVFDVPTNNLLLAITVPEPATLALLVAGGLLAVLGRVRRKR